jgi:hypothetical protein
VTEDDAAVYLYRMGMSIAKVFALSAWQRLQQAPGSPRTERGLGRRVHGASAAVECGGVQ